MPRIGLTAIARLTVLTAVFVTTGVSRAQSPNIPPQMPPRHYPLRHDMPPGAIGYWAGMVRQPSPADFTFVRVELPSPGQVEIYAEPGRPTALPRNGCGLAIGRLYRMKITGLEDFPGVELYPSIEVVDKTHPPPGREHEFAVPVRFSTEEIEEALSGRLVTKVVYVEQPQVASPFPTEDGMVLETLTPNRNLIKEADLRGRPLLVVRLGARTPDPHFADPQFFGPGGPVIVPTATQMPPASAMPNE